LVLPDAKRPFALLAMPLLRETFLLFLLNLFDAILTIIWVRSGVAGEGNLLMARLLEIGDATFLGVKIAIGTLAALVLLRWGNRRLARYGVALAIAVYLSVMGVHLMTYLTAAGYLASSGGFAFPNPLEFLRAGI
jgi:hypothetical protein